MCITDEYMDYYAQYTREYGENTCILMQIGSFYEMHMVKNEKETIGNIFEVCNLLNIQVTRRNKSIEKIDRSNPYMAGFPIHSFSKYLPILLEHQYTVIVIDQEEGGKAGTKQRKIGAIYSPSIPPLDLDKNIENSALTCILMESDHISVGYLNVTTNRFEVIEFSECLDELEKYVWSHPSNEYLVYCSDPDSISEKFEFLMNTTTHFLELNTVKEQLKLDYQNALLRKVYSHLSFGMLEPIEYFDLERYPSACLTVVMMLEFVSKHNKAYLMNLQVPVYMDTVKYLSLEMNTLQQLSILPDSSVKHRWNSLFAVINKTKTPIGKRALKRLLCNPLKDPSTIELKYQWNDFIGGFSNVDSYLSEIGDLERLHRKMALEVLTVQELHSLHRMYDTILQLYAYLFSSETASIDPKIDSEIELLKEYRADYHSHIDASKIHSVYCFRTGVFPILDEMENKIESYLQEMESMRSYYEKLIKKPSDKGEWIKLAFTEQEGHFFTCTKIRAQSLQRELKKLDSTEVKFKTQTSTSKFTTSALQTLSITLRSSQEKFYSEVQIVYKQLLSKWYTQYKAIFQPIQDFIEKIDIAHSNYKCKTAYGYCRPILEPSSTSSITARQLRHPIIERVNTSIPYTPNDICLSDRREDGENDDNEISHNGMILYALNSGGKSSLLRSIGLCVIMAQCGMYVPCSEMRYSPFHSIITQVDMVDNLWKSQSSFVSEMIGLKRILKIANPYCLVLSDELTKGTEVVSATSIFTATILELATKQSKFVFTTHLQNVAKIEEIKTHPRVRICHLAVSIQNKQIQFERTLKDGPSSELYGLEVARAVGLEDAFMNRSFEIREQLLNISSTIQLKRSKYNREKILDECEICHYKPFKPSDIPLDTHHIKFQCQANEHEFTEHYHKNTKCNLVCLCKQCHIQVHQGKIQISGYIATSNGVEIQYKKVKTKR